MIAFIGGRSGQGWQIYTTADDGIGLRCLTDSISSRESIYFEPIWSPNGRSLVFTFKEQIYSPYAQVCTIDIDSEEVHYLTPRDQLCYAKQWLSNGSIVYKEETIRPQEADSYLCTMNSDGSEAQRIFHYSSYRGVTFTSDSYNSVEVSPDGNKIAMTSWKDSQLYIVREASNPFPIENEGLKIQEVSWSSDSSMLAFTASRSQALVYHDLYLSREDGTNQQRLGRVLAESGFSWSPDDKHIATVSSRKGKIIIHNTHIQSGELRTIAEIEVNPASGGPPNCLQWSSDSQSILYTTFADPYEHICRADIATGKAEIIVGDEGSFVQISYLSSFSS